MGMVHGLRIFRPNSGGFSLMLSSLAINVLLLFACRARVDL